MRSSKRSRKTRAPATSSRSSRTERSAESTRASSRRSHAEPQSRDGGTDGSSSIWTRTSRVCSDATYVAGNALYWAQGDEPQRIINRYDLVTKTITKNVLDLVAKIWNPVVTRDELTIYWAWNREGVDLPSIIHIATRKSTSEPFGPPVRVDALPKNSGVTWVSDDRCEVLFETWENNRRVVRFAKSN